MDSSYEFIVTRDVYNEIEDDEGAYKVVLVKENVKTKWYCKNIDKVSSCEQTYNEKGNVRTEYTKIMVDGEGEKIVRMRYKDVKQLIKKTDMKSVGFGG